MPHVRPALPSWLSTVSSARILPTGRWFDAIEVDSFTAIYVLGRLGYRSGPVIEDQVQGVARWLIEAGVAAGWDLPGVRVLRHGDHVVVPPASTTSGPWAEEPSIHWLLRPSGTCLMEAALLRQVLVRATASRARTAASHA